MSANRSCRRQPVIRLIFTVPTFEHRFAEAHEVLNLVLQLDVWIFDHDGLLHPADTTDDRPIAVSGTAIEDGEVLFLWSPIGNGLRSGKPGPV